MTEIYASDPANSQGRLLPEPEDAYRSVFARDRDRIIHCTAFRRLMHKTQVFVAYEDDHYRTRLTHTLEVAQIARTLAVELGFNTDLTEAIALAHDLGHPPFGHKGEDVLAALMGDYGGFDHNAQAIKIVTSLEDRYARFNGLNLSWEMLEGMAKHNGPIGGAIAGETAGAVPYALAEYNTKHDLRLNTHASGEAQIAAIADDIAYNHHDLDDGLRAGLFTLGDIAALPLVAEALQIVDERYPDLNADRRRFEMLRCLIKAMANDVIATARAGLAQGSPRSVDGLRDAGAQLIDMSAEFKTKLQQVRKFLYENMYRSDDLMQKRAQYEVIIERLFAAFVDGRLALPDGWGDKYTHDYMQNGVDAETLRMRQISDYLSGMTDSFATKLCEQIA